QDTGAPIRMADAIVCGSASGESRLAPALHIRTKGFAPSACTTASLGSRSIRPIAIRSSSAVPHAARLPRFPPGSAITSGHRHPGVLERPGRVPAEMLDRQLWHAGIARRHEAAEHRRISFAERDDVLEAGGNGRQQLPEPPDTAAIRRLERRATGAPDGTQLV